MLKEHSEKKLILEAFDYYFSERPLIDEIEFWKVPRDTISVETFEVNKPDTTAQPQALKEIEPGFRFIAFNFRKPSIVHQLSFRKAIYHLLDIKEMWRDLGRKESDLVEASSFLIEKSVPQKKSPKLVQESLEKSGYQGEPLKLYIPESPRAREECAWLQQKGESYGLQFIPVYFKMEELYTSRLKEDADLISLGEVSSEDTHLSFLGAFLNESLIFRQFLLKEHLQQLEKWLDELKKGKNVAEREYWIDRIEDVIRAEHLIIFKHHPIRNKMFHPMIKDANFELYGHVDLRKLWIQ